MAYSSANAITGGSDPPKKRRKPKPPPPVSINAELGGEGQAATERAARKARRGASADEVIASARAVLGGEDVAKSTRRAVRRAKKARREEAAMARLEAAINEPDRYARLTERKFDRQLANQLRRGDVYLEEPEDDPGFAERLLAGGVVGLVDEDASAAGRRAIWGTENPGAEEVAAAILLPVGGKVAQRIYRAGKAAKGAATVDNAVDVAEDAAKTAREAQERLLKVADKAETPSLRARAAGATKAAPGKAKRAAKSAPANAKTRYSQTGRKVRRTKRAQTLGTVGALSPAAATVAASVAGTTAEAIKEDIEEGKPLRTLKTTGRTAWALPGAVVGDAIDIGSVPVRAAGKALGVNDLTWGEVSDPAEVAARSQVDYWEAVGKVAEGGPEGREIVQEDLGLVPLIGGGLTALGLAKPFTSPSSAPAPTRKVRRLAERARTGETPRARREARQELEQELGETPRQRRRGRKREAERAAVTGEQREAQFARETKGKGARRASKLGRRESLVESVGRMGREPLDEQVSKADVIQFLGREGLAVDDAAFALDEVKKRRASLIESKHEIDPDEVHTRAVIDAIVKHPEVLRDHDVRRAIEGFAELQRGRSQERLQGRVGAEEAQGRIDPLDERPRLQHVARAEDIRTPEERIPKELEGQTKVRPRKGQDAAKAIRGEIKALTNRAKRLEAQAVAMRSSRPERAATLEQRAARYRGEAEVRQAVVNRHRRANGLERNAARLEAAGEVDAATAMRDEARDLRQTAEAEQARLLEEFVGETNERIAQRGYRQPIYFKESDVADRGGLTVQQNYPGAKSGTKEKFRRGSLAEQGRIDESGLTLIENTYRNRAAMAQNEAALDFLSDQLLMSDKTKSDVGRGVAARELNLPETRRQAEAEISGSLYKTGPQWRKLQREGELPQGTVLVPVQEFTAALQRADLDGADTILASSLKRDVQRARFMGEAEQGSRRVYGAVPESALKEFRAQMEPLNKAWRGARAISRLQTGLMLATSPAWFAFQIVATPLVMAARHPNPLAWGRASVKAVQLWRNADERTRVDFRSHFGGNPADILSLGDVQTAMKADTVRSMSDALKFAFRSPAGRMVHAIGQNIRKGGPLMAANRRYEGALRHFGALLEMDRLTGLNRHGEERPIARVKQFAESVAGLTDTTFRHMEQLRGKDVAEQVAWYTRNPKAMRELEDRVNDSQGNWAALTSAERRISSVAVFYPFLRFSLRWLFYSFPKDNPIKTAIFLNLAQQNAEELEIETGGAPDFLSDWGTVITHTGKGGSPQAINLARAAPGSNAIIESIGGEKFDLSSVLRPMQPIIGATALALEGKDTFGNEVEGANFLDLMGRGLVSLSPLTRPLRDDIGPETSHASLLFRALEGRDGGLSDGLIPDIVGDLDEAKDVRKLSKWFDQSARRPTGSEQWEASTPEMREALARRERTANRAQRHIDKWMRQQGIETKQQQRAEEKAGSENYGAVEELIEDSNPEREDSNPEREEPGALDNLLNRTPTNNPRGALERLLSR